MRQEEPSNGVLKDEEVEGSSYVPEYLRQIERSKTRRKTEIRNVGNLPIALRKGRYPEK